jgi:hypothetical protein
VSRLRIVNEEEATGPLAEVYAAMKANQPRGIVPDIMKTMSLRPDILPLVAEVAGRLHFSPGALTRAQHEMIASYVSALTRCHY